LILLFHNPLSLNYILDSERNLERIDFTMMCVLLLSYLFVSVYTISSRNNAFIFNFIILFDWKVNLYGAKMQGKTKKINTENRNFHRKFVFNKIDFVFWCNSTANDHRHTEFDNYFVVTNVYNFQLLCVRIKNFKQGFKEIGHSYIKYIIHNIIKYT